MLQYVELIYLVCKNYWVYALINALFTWAYTISLLRTVLAHETKMVSLMNRPRLVPVVQGGWVRAAGSHRLVPGDIMVLQRGQATCDMVVLQGSCLVEESMLSGEVGLSFQAAVGSCHCLVGCHKCCSCVLWGYINPAVGLREPHVVHFLLSACCSERIHPHTFVEYSYIHAGFLPDSCCLARLLAHSLTPAHLLARLHAHPVNHQLTLYLFAYSLMRLPFYSMMMSSIQISTQYLLRHVRL